MSDNFNDSFFQKVLSKFSHSREITVSFFLHIILVAVFGTAVLFEAKQEPPDFEGEGGGFVAQGDAATAPPDQAQTTPQETTFEVTTQPVQQTSALNAITTTAVNPLNFEMSQMIMPTQTVAPPSAAPPPPPPTTTPGMQGMTPQIAASIKAFTQGGHGKGAGSGTGTRQREFEFVAFIGQYAGGNWDSTITLDKAKTTVRKGSLPNLLWFMSEFSKNKIKTNEKNIKVIKLDSEELFAAKPPFIFMTGSQDFKLSEKEVANLQKYVRMGGCIWGDSSLPGRNSRFDIAFRREMRRIIPDVDKDFLPLSPNHPIYSSASYFPEIKEVPPGLNFYKEPVYALSIYGEIGILYTANDYGDMWQIGITETGEVNMAHGIGEDGKQEWRIFVNTELWNNYLYFGNIRPHGWDEGKKPPVIAKNLLDTYKFGVNIIFHLLTRWDRVAASAPSL